MGVAIGLEMRDLRIGIREGFEIDLVGVLGCRSSKTPRLSK